MKARAHDGMTAAPALTLLTDYGWSDPWVAQVKGVLHAVWARWPDRRPPPAVADLAHDLPRGDVEAAAWFLLRAAPCWPPGTVHVAVVDPGVGGDRPAVACRARGGIFVAPGNGLLGFLAGEAGLEVVRLDRPLYAWRPQGMPASTTFAGRDVFAPAAAHLAMGAPLAQVGSPAAAADLGVLPQAGPAVSDRCRIVWIDRFGNVITDLARSGPAGQRLAGGGELSAGGRRIRGPLPCYAAGGPGEPFWYWGSGGTLEVAVRDDSAAGLLGLARGMDLRVELP